MRCSGHEVRVGWRSLGTMPVFQDHLFSPARVVERTLASGTVIRLKLEPLPREWVRVLEYHRKALGEGWKRVRIDADTVGL